MSANQALAPPPSAQQQAPLKAAIALPQTRSSVPAKGVSSAMPSRGEHLQASSPASQAATPSSSASYSRELAGTAPQQQLQQAASRPGTVSQTRPRPQVSKFAAEPSSTAPPPGLKPAGTVQAQGSPAVSSTVAVADHTPPGFGPQHTPTDHSQHSLMPAASSSRASASPGVRQDPPPASQRLPYSTHPALSGTDDYPPGFTHPGAPMTQVQPSNAGDVAAVMPAKSSVQHSATHSLSSRTQSLSSSELANSSQPSIVLPIPISAETPSSSIHRSSQAGAAALSPAASASTSTTSHDVPPGFAAVTSVTKPAISQPPADVPPGFAQSQSLLLRRPQSQSLTPASSSRLQVAAATSAEQGAAGESHQGVSDLPPGFRPASQFGSSDFNSQGNSSRQNTPAALSARHQTPPVSGTLQTAPPAQQQWGDEGQARNPAAQQGTATHVSGLQKAGRAELPPGFPAASTQAQVVGLASHRMPLSRPNLTSSSTSHNVPKFASGFLVPDRGQPRSKPSPAQSRPTSSRPDAHAASDLQPGFASLAIGQEPNQAPNGMGRSAERASSSVQSGDALSWAVAEQLVLPITQKPVITIVPIPPVAGDSPWGDPGKAVKKNGVQSSVSKVHIPAENVRCLDECLGHDCPMLYFLSCKTSSLAAITTFSLPSLAFLLPFVLLVVSCVHTNACTLQAGLSMPKCHREISAAYCSVS